MAYRRNITARAKLLYQQQQGFAPSFSYIHRDDNDHSKNPNNNLAQEKPKLLNYSQQGFFGMGHRFGNFNGSRSLIQDRRFLGPMGCGSVFAARNMSSTSIGEGTADKIEIMSDVVEVLADRTAEVAAQAGPLMNEVVAATAESYPPVAAIQYLIGYVQSFTGFNWWASIVLTTLLIRGLTLPFNINQIKATSKLTLMRPHLEEIREDMNNRSMSPTAVAEGQEKMQALFKEYGVTPFTAFRGLLIQGPIFVSTFFAINNMVEKVPSFKHGGAFWFTDLTTPDSLYICPILMALTFWITVECNAQEGMEGNPMAGTMKNVMRAFAALSIPFTLSFPKAIFCYWITSNLFSFAYGMAIKKPEVKKLLGIPIIPVTPASTAQKPGFSFFKAVQKYAEGQAQKKFEEIQPPSLPSTAETSRPTNQRIPPSSVLNQRIKSLEKEVKGRKKGKKR